MRIKTIALLGLLLLIFTSQAEAQRRRHKKKEPKPAYYFKDHLWYGGGFSLGFAGQSGASVFNFGLSPIVGYKFGKIFSAGPRVDINVTTGRAQTFSGVDAFTYADYGVGIFTRAKFLPYLFAHLEAGYKNYGIPVVGSEVEILRYDRDVLQLGLGYTNGGEGQLGVEYLLLYDFLFPKDSPQLPIEFRIGLNYNF